MNDLNIPPIEFDSTIPDNFNPFEFQCDHCSQKHVFTQERIEKVKQKVKGTNNDYFILCQKCQTGHMQPPSLVLMGGAYQ